MPLFKHMCYACATSPISFGSYTAVLLSTERPLTCLSLRVPASYPDEGFADPQQPQTASGGLTKWRQLPLDHSQNHACEVLHDFKRAVQIVEAENDEMVPHQAVAKYINAVRDHKQLEYHVMKNAPHRLANAILSSEYIQLLIEWAKNELK